MATTKPKTNSKKNKSRRGIFAKRPKFFKPSVLVIIGVAAVSVGIYLAFTTFATAGVPSNCKKNCTYSGQIEVSIATWTNNLRTSRGVRPAYLPLDSCLSGMARSWAEKMANNYSRLVHMSEVMNYGNTVTIVCGGGWSRLGENLAYAPPGALPQCDKFDYNGCGWAFVDYLWINSPEHLANILYPNWTRQGVGVYRDWKGGTWVVAEFETK